ncbi:tetratricopeptide repeat protein 21A-like [Artemia franciscana]|uniref:tetratricopeptide repeat protein 21A-like n=1 Tax=Artemia franciscana TaxID=6661 RepID=UPI0032DA9978
MEPRAADEENRLLYLHATKKLKIDSLEREVYTSFGQLLSAKKSEADAIFNNMEIMNNDAVPYQLLQAVAFLSLKQVPKAKLTLKRLGQSPWTFENGEWLEKGWLLLAKIYINSNKGEQAKEFCQRVLKYNASSLSALELMGSIAEREHSYSEAAKSYGAVWKRSKCTTLSVGYHLANCLLKAKRFTETINLCQDLMRIQPNFPRLQKDIYEKALNLIRS